MKPPPFSYHNPKTLPEALALLGRLENAKLLAGGQSLMPMLNMRFVLPDHVIDLNQVGGLDYIRDDGKEIEIGSMTRQRDIEFSDVIRRKLPLMHEAILQVGHRQTRNRGTLGGSLCHFDPSAELVTVAAALDATVLVDGKSGRRKIPFAEFPRSYMASAVEADEILSAARFPVWPDKHGYGFVEFARRHGDFAIVSTAALLEEDSAGKILRAAVTIGGVAAAPVRLPEVEAGLKGAAASDELFRKVCESFRKIDALEDIHAPSSYRQHLATVLSRRALEKAHARAQGRPVPKYSHG